MPLKRTFSARNLSKLLCIFLTPLLLSYLAVVYSIWHQSRQTDSGHFDAAIVLGTAVIDGRPSAVFRERLRHAIQLYHSGRVQALVFTGGVGAGQHWAESEVGRQFALAHRVPASAIRIETHSHTTFQNLVYARPLLKSAQIKRVVLVSDPMHMRRALTQAFDLGINASASPTPSTRYRSWQTQSAFLLRESLYYSTYLIWRLSPNASAELAALEPPIDRSRFE